MPFQKGMLLTFELMLVALTCAWVTGLVEVISHVESLALQSRVGVGFALGISGVLLFIAWLMWLIIISEKFENLNTFVNRGLVVATMLGGWLAGFVWSVTNLQEAPKIQTHPTIAVLIISGILVLIFCIHWFWVGMQAMYYGSFANSDNGKRG